jgi:hypothetical protein
LAALCAAGGAAAEARLALLIGNQDYPASVGRLSLPHEDVARLEAALAATGFAVTTLRDADEDATELAVARFRRELEQAGPDAVGFFYYSGHGVSAVTGGRRRNYLIPAGADVTDADTLAARAVEEGDVVDVLAEAGAKALFIVIDACRNELAPAFSRSAADKGFGVTASRPGIFIAHATFPGETAPDDGAFSAALARQLIAPGTVADRAFTLAYREVAASRRGYALPTVAAALSEDFCFVSCPGDPAPAVAPPAAPTAEALTREAQQLLAGMGYEPGPADGAAGRSTGDAVAAFRAATGLGAGRSVDADLVAALRLFSAQGHRAPARPAVIDPGDAASATDASNAPQGGGWLGVRIGIVSEELATSLGLDEARGALVMEVVPGGPGETAGFLDGDVVTAAKRTRIDTSQQLAEMMQASDVGEVVRFTVVREGAQIELAARLTERPADAPVAELVSDPEPCLPEDVDLDAAPDGFAEQFREYRSRVSDCE